VKVNYTQIATHIIALTIVLAVIYGQTVGAETSELLIGAFGLVVNQYLRRQTEDDVHTQSERVLSQQVMVEPSAQVR
jgi:hypothetical protein